MNAIKDRDDLFCRIDLSNFFNKEEVELISRRCNNHIPFSITKKSKVVGGFTTYKHYSLSDFEEHLNIYVKPNAGRPILIAKAISIETIRPKLKRFRIHLLNR